MTQLTKRSNAGTQTIQYNSIKSNNERSQNKTNFAAVVASYDSRPENEVDSFYSSRGGDQTTDHQVLVIQNNGNIIFNDICVWNELPCHVKSAPSLRSSVVV